MGAFFVILIGLYPGRVSGRVSDFFDKIRTRPGPASGFFFLNPYPTLFLIESGKTRSIRVGSGQVPAGRAKIAIPIGNSQFGLYYFKFAVNSILTVNSLGT